MRNSRPDLESVINAGVSSIPILFSSLPDDFFPIGEDHHL